MRTTVRIDDDLLAELKAYAHKEGISVAKLFNQAVRQGFEIVKREDAEQPAPFVQKTYNMGKPKIDLTKASQIAADLYDQDLIRNMRSVDENSRHEHSNLQH